jgi:hypothetical protein
MRLRDVFVMVRDLEFDRSAGAVGSFCIYDWHFD